MDQRLRCFEVVTENYQEKQNVSDIDASAYVLLAVVIIIVANKLKNVCLTLKIMLTVIYSKTDP